MDSAPDTCPQTELSCGADHPATREPKETDDSNYTVYLKVHSQSTSGGTGSAMYSNFPGKSVELRSKYIGQ